MSIDTENRGFTLVELVTVMGVFVLLAATAMPVYGNLQSASILNDTSDQFVQILRYAQHQSCNGKDASDHGVYLENSEDLKVTIFSGSSYLMRNIELDELIDFEDNATITTDLAGNEIVFRRGTCLPDRTGSFEIGSKTLERKRNFQINALGVISE